MFSVLFCKKHLFILFNFISFFYIKIPFSPPSPSLFPTSPCPTQHIFLRSLKASHGESMISVRALLWVRTNPPPPCLDWVALHRKWAQKARSFIRVCDWSHCSRPTNCQSHLLSPADPGELDLSYAGFLFFCLQSLTSH